MIKTKVIIINYNYNNNTYLVTDLYAQKLLKCTTKNALICYIIENMHLQCNIIEYIDFISYGKRVSRKRNYLCPSLQYCRLH